jgi:hypothetical protein
MSLKEKCMELKEEIFRLKKKSNEPKEIPEPKVGTTSQKELRNILFPKEKQTIVDEITSPRSNYNSAPVRRNSSHNLSIDKENYNTVNLTQQAYLMNKTNVKSEVLQIKKINEVPMDYINRCKERIKEKPPLANVSNYSSNISENNTRRYDEEENFEKRKKVLLISRFLKEEEDKVQPPKIVKVDFAQLCSQLYNQKKDKNAHTELKEMISKKNRLF